MESNWLPACGTSLPSISDCSTPQTTPFTPSPDRRFRPRRSSASSLATKAYPNLMKYTPRHSRLVAVLVAAISACASIQAQTAPSPAQPANAPVAPNTTVAPKVLVVPNTPAASDEQVIVLSPFEVRATRGSESYVEETTLAGNRLSTDLRDIGSSVSVVTSQFLTDTNATDNTSLLIRIGGAEVGGVNGNFASPGPGASSALLTEDIIKPTEDTRIRGLAAADNTRDFFPSDIPWDSYNTDRIDIQRGPNAILFGEGS